MNVAVCGKTHRGLEELSREEALDLVQRLMFDGAEVQGQSVRDFASGYDIFIEEPKDSLTHKMVQEEIKRLYDFGVAHYGLPPAEVLDCGEVNDLVGWIVIGEFDKWGFEIGYGIDNEIVNLADGWGFKEMHDSLKKGFPRFLASIKKIAFKG